MPSEESPDPVLEALLQRYLQGEMSVCDRLLNDPQYRQRIERLVRRTIRGTFLTWEDASQEAHLKVLQAARNGKFRQGGVKAFYSWTATVAQNAIIDLVRTDKRKRGPWLWQSLDQLIPHTDMRLWETLADDFNLSDAVERADLVLRVRDAIEKIDRRYPQKNFLQLWQGLVAQKTQSQLAAELGVKQGEISKRRKELSIRVGNELGLLNVERVEAELRTIRQGRPRQRSDRQW